MNHFPMDRENQQGLLGGGGGGGGRGATRRSNAAAFPVGVGPTRRTLGLACALSSPVRRLASSLSHRLHHYQNRILMDDHENDYPSRVGDCLGYSRPFVFLDVIWNLAFVLVSTFVLLTTIKEKPSTPLRLWISCYAFQCLLHVGFVWLENRNSNLDDYDREVSDGCSILSACSSTAKSLEPVNTVLASIWWVFGFYWIVMGGQMLIEDAPRLYWLSVVFLAFDVFFMIFCVGMACIIFFGLFCCFPILATVAYAMTLGDGASEEDIQTLPRYKYCPPKTMGALDDENVQKEVVSCGQIERNNSIPEISLPPEDSECCICLFKYVDGAELCRLPCSHHFHYKCIGKWLRINAICPLCKFNILRGEMLV